MAQTSGDSAKRERGKRVDDDTTLPSERIVAGAREAGGQILSSGDMAKELHRLCLLVLKRLARISIVAAEVRISIT
jgi:hypothetical protein